MDDNAIGVVELNSSAKLVFSVSSWKGRRYASIRKFVATSKYTGPTKSGLSLSPEHLLGIFEILQKLNNELASPQNKEFARIKKNTEVDIVIATVEPDELNALPSVDIREYVDSPRYVGPTKKGIRVPWEKLAEILAMLNSQAIRLDAIDSDQKTLFPSIQPEWKNKVKNIESSKPCDQSGILGEILPNGPHEFPNDFIEEDDYQGKDIEIPTEPLEVKQLPDGKHIVCSQFEYSISVRNETEGNFIVYSHLRGNKEVRLPEKMIILFKAVKAYENYVRKLRQSFITAFERKSGYKPMAIHQTKEIFRSFGLPWLD